MALTEATSKNRTVELGGPQNFTNNQVAELYGRSVGVTPKVNHLPPQVARVMSVVLKLFQPCLSRILYMNSLPDTAFGETFEPANLKEYPVKLTTLEAFIRERIAKRG